MAVGEIENREKLLDTIIASKHEIVANKDEIIANKDVIIAKSNKEVLQAKGLMNVRSIYELFLRQCFDELIKTGFIKAEEKFNVSALVNKIWARNTPTYSHTTTMATAAVTAVGKSKSKTPVVATAVSIPAAAVKTIAFLKAARNCNCDLPSLYVTLCREIHGSLWNGESVAVYQSDMVMEESCIVQYFVGEMSLNCLLR